MQRLLWPVAAAAAFLPAALRAQPPAGLEEIVVTAAFRDTKIEQLPASVTVLDREELRETTQQHFEEAIRQVPNLNLSGEGSRARYFQLRGVGELEQYEGSPNPSVGFIVDDIDFSGLGSLGTLFDIDRVEVLRGPQGTRYGANALGGLIYLRSMEPSREHTANFETTVGSDGTRALGAATGGPLGDTLRYRASIQKYENDGFRDNVFLHRSDTYGRDELTARGKLAWKPSDKVTVDLAGLYVDIGNGYDAWALDNGFKTYSDKPGRDAQRSKAISARVTAELPRFDLVSITGIADTNAVFSFDADWGNAAYWAPYTYDYVEGTNRERRTYNEEVRLLSKPGALLHGRGDWLAGVYALDLTEDNDHRINGVYADPFCGAVCDISSDSDAVSHYNATNVAVFGEVRISLSTRLDFTAGLRTERRSAHYDDNSANRFAPDDDMSGGEVALDWRWAPRSSAYVRLARGYKAGGFNVSLAGVDFSAVDGLTANEISFGPEFLTSLEAGWRATFADGRLRTDIGAFAARRTNQQIKVPIQLVLGDPSSFLFVTANAERSEHHGVEASLEWRANDRIAVNAATGWLETKIEQFSLFPLIEGREEAHSPRYTYSLGATYRATSGWWGRVDLSGMGEFFFDYGHDQSSKPYGLTNLSVGRDWGGWSAKLWVRNVFDKDYFVRGFYFGNQPPDFPSTLYTRLGDPRHFGVTLNYRW